jgi:transposase
MRIRKSLARLIAALEKELAEIDAEIDAGVRGTPAWREKEDLLASVPGVGPITARTLIAELPELGTLDGKRIASLAGLAPFTRQSGQWKGKALSPEAASPCAPPSFSQASSPAVTTPSSRPFANASLTQANPKCSSSSPRPANSSPSSTPSCETNSHGAQKPLDRQHSR